MLSPRRRGGVETGGAGMRVGALFATRASRMLIIHRWKTRYDGLHADQAGQLGQRQDGSVKRGEDFSVPEPSEGESRSIITVPASGLSKATPGGRSALVVHAGQHSTSISMPRKNAAARAKRAVATHAASLCRRPVPREAGPGRRSAPHRRARPGLIRPSDARGCSDSGSGSSARRSSGSRRRSHGDAGNRHRRCSCRRGRRPR